MRTPTVWLLVMVGLCGCDPRAAVRDVRRVALLGVSTQGVDFGLFNEDGEDLGLPLTGATVTMNDMTFDVEGRVCGPTLGVLSCSPATSSVISAGLTGLPEGLVFSIEDDTGRIAATWPTPPLSGNTAFAQAPDRAPGESIAVVVDSPLPFLVRELEGTWCTSPGGDCDAANLRVDGDNGRLIRLTAPTDPGDHVATFPGATRYSDPVRCDGDDVACDRFLDDNVEITVAVTVHE